VAEVDDWDDTPDGAPTRQPGSQKSRSGIRQTTEYKKFRKAFRLQCQNAISMAGDRGAPCWLCSEPIDYRLRRPHPFAWEMDHIIPVSEAPNLALDHNNVAAAHHDCNQRRGTSEPALHLGTPSEIWASVLVMVLCMVGYGYEPARAILGQD